MFPKQSEILKHFDTGSIIVIAITFIFFAMALFFTGFTHSLLLEAGVFLVSVKLIMMSYKTSVVSKEIYQDLEEIKDILKTMNNHKIAADSNSTGEA